MKCGVYCVLELELPAEISEQQRRAALLEWFQGGLVDKPDQEWRRRYGVRHVGLYGLLRPDGELVGEAR